jgi:hypothetical protein
MFIEMGYVLVFVEVSLHIYVIFYRVLFFNKTRSLELEVERTGARAPSPRAQHSAGDSHDPEKTSVYSSQKCSIEVYRTGTRGGFHVHNTPGDSHAGIRILKKDG